MPLTMIGGEGGGVSAAALEPSSVEQERTWMIKYIVDYCLVLPATPPAPYIPKQAKQGHYSA
jgi:hypothetical protein